MFSLPKLPFPENALEPFMSRDTLMTHHGKHHAAYIKKTNAALAEMKDAPTTLEAVVRAAARDKNKSLFNNSAQAWNHAFFWNCLTPSPQPGPTGALKAAIEKAFGDLAGFRDRYLDAAEKHFASGWAWLVADAEGAVSIRDLHDADTPIVDASATPLLTLDLWEHAYYLDYKNDRPAYLEACYDKLVNWRFAEAQYTAARAGGEAWRFPS